MRYARWLSLRAMVIACATAGVAFAATDPNTWLEVAPEETQCWDGTPWKFWYRPGSDDRLVIWFQGGGGCWRTELCDPTGEPTFDGSVGPNDHPAASGGLLDNTKLDNPLRNWRAVLLPYCTGDVHIGRRTVDYTRADGSTFRVAHEGQRNTRTALDWLEARLAAEGTPPPRVFVSGESAGGIAASYWAAEIGDRFPSAGLSVVGDAAGGYRSVGVVTTLRQWGVLDTLPDLPAYADPNRVYFESFYVAAGQRHPTAQLAQVNFADDATQRRFLDLLGGSVDVLTKGLTCNLNEIRIESPNFHSYIYPGSQHTMLRTSAVYTTACRGEPLIDWIARISRGEAVQNQWCDGGVEALQASAVPRL